MKVLYLGPWRQHMIDYLRSRGDEVVHTDKRFGPSSGVTQDIDMIVSYGYRHLLKEDILCRFDGKVINLHISLLPWNRGKDPNLWSFLEDTPKGVSIHRIDPGIDTGPLLAQREVFLDDAETLRTSYAKLSESIEGLFREVWPEVRLGRGQSFAQPSGGSFHWARDKAAVEHLLRLGWDTPVAELVGRIARPQATPLATGGGS